MNLNTLKQKLIYMHKSEFNSNNLYEKRIKTYLPNSVSDKCHTT